MEYFGPTTSTGAAPPANDAQRIRQQATALHRAGEYEEAAREFARAADLLESTGVGLAPPALSAIRLSLAAAQLKVLDHCDGSKIAKAGFASERYSTVASRYGLAGR